MLRSFRLVLLSGSLVLSGCALTTDRVDIQYAAPVGASRIAGADSVPVNVHVTDSRLDKTRVGSKKNGFGMEMAPILATEDVAVTVRRAVEEGLRVRGFKVSSAGASVQIQGDLTRFYNDHKPGFFAGDAVADLAMNVVVRARTGELLYTRHIVSQGLEPNIQLMTGENARLALNRALHNGITMLFEDQAFLDAVLTSKAAGARGKNNSNPM